MSDSGSTRLEAVEHLEAKTNLLLEMLHKDFVVIYMVIPVVVLGNLEMVSKSVY